MHWKPQKLGSPELDTPLVALAFADLDGDGKPELYAVTAREVIALAVGEHRVREIGRVPFAGERRVAAPRDVVGAAIADGGVLVASVSTYAARLRVSWRGKTLVGEPAGAGFALCPGERAVLLAAGRDHVGSGPSAYYTLRCREMLDPQARTLKVRATLSVAGRLDINAQACGASGCEPAGHHELGNVGYAFDVADFDRDGAPEVIYAAASAPGDPDTIKVVTWDGDEKKPLYRKDWKADGVAAIVVGDLDGTGAPVAIAAVRIPGETRVDLWRLN